MKQKILLFALLAWIAWYAVIFANDLQVRSNIDSGNYDFALEVYLLSNDKNAKIFYYTDGIGRFDTLKEFIPNEPLIIKKDTTLNFYAINDMNNSTKIAEAQYSFSYPENIKLSYEDEKIIIKNISGKTINIGYFQIESELLKYEIYKNTFLWPQETYTLKYIAKPSDAIKLITPDGKQITRFEVQPPKPEEPKTTPPENILIENVQEIAPVENTQNSQETREEQAQILEQNEIISLENIKASASETKTASKDIYFLLYGFVAFIFFMTCYNIFTLIQTHKKSKNKNKKLSKK